MKSETQVTQAKLEKLSDSNVSKEYLRNLSKVKRISQKSKYSAEQVKFISEEVHNLKNNEKAIIHLFFWEDLSIEEISSRTGKQVRTVRKVLKESIQKLKASYQESFREIAPDSEISFETKI